MSQLFLVPGGPVQNQALHLQSGVALNYPERLDIDNDFFVAKLSMKVRGRVILEVNQDPDTCQAAQLRRQPPFPYSTEIS